MIGVSEAYKELVKRNVRPKCEPKIVLVGEDETGNGLRFEWNPSNIKDLSYKRGIDPIGRELPFMELTWTEIYSGKLDENLFPEKYNNVGKHMKVELSFSQKLSFFNTWKTMFQKGFTWKNLAGKTWKSVRTGDDNNEIIKFPTMFLTETPTYKGQTITWKAVDILSFLVEQQTKAFSSFAKFKNPIRYFLINEIGNFKNSKYICECLKKCGENMNDERYISNDEKIGNYVIFDGTTRRLIVEHLQLKNKYFDFDEDGAFSIRSVDDSVENGMFDKMTLWKYPEIKKNPTISNYTFKSYTLTKNEEKKYVKTPVFYKTLKGYNIYKTDYDGYGGTNGGDDCVLSLSYHLSENDRPIEITPINWTPTDNLLYSNEKGEVLSENITVNTYGRETNQALERFEYLKKYFKNSSSVSFSCLPDLSVETGDTSFVETNLYVGNQQTTKKCLIVGIDIKYSGVVKQSFSAHEISLGGVV